MSRHQLVGLRLPCQGCFLEAVGEHILIRSDTALQQPNRPNRCPG